MVASSSGTRVGFVLAGGGTKGAFEVGAIGYLVQHAGLLPQVITAASAGSIVGSVLAQGRTPDEFDALAVQLRHDLLAMADLDAVFGRQPWLADVAGTPLGDAIERVLQRRPALPLVDDATVATMLAELDRPAPNSRRHHVRRNLHAVGATLAHAGSLVQARHDLSGNISSFLTLDPLGAALAGTGSSDAIAPVDPELVARPGLSLRLAVTALGSGTTRYVTGDGVVVEADARTPYAQHPQLVGLVEAVLTSSSAPLVFPPRRWDDDIYNDGGVTDNLPVRAALACGATDIVAIAAMPLQQPDPTDFTDSSFLAVHQRSSAVMFLDQQRRSLATDMPDGARLTAVVPTVDVVGAFEVNPGLLHIDMHYGALRAQESLAALDEADRRRASACTDRTITARDMAWHLEEQLCGEVDGRQRSRLLDAVRRCKEQVAAAMQQRRALGLVPPVEVDSWASTWEHHEAEPAAALPPRP